MFLRCFLPKLCKVEQDKLSIFIWNERLDWCSATFNPLIFCHSTTVSVESIIGSQTETNILAVYLF